MAIKYAPPASIMLVSSETLENTQAAISLIVCFTVARYTQVSQQVNK